VALVLAAPTNRYLQLTEPHVMLGAMYGDLGFRAPFHAGPGAPPDDVEITPEFLIVRGKMFGHLVYRTR